MSHRFTRWGLLFAGALLLQTASAKAFKLDRSAITAEHVKNQKACAAIAQELEALEGAAYGKSGAKGLEAKRVASLVQQLEALERLAPKTEKAWQAWDTLSVAQREAHGADLDWLNANSTSCESHVRTFFKTLATAWPSTALEGRDAAIAFLRRRTERTNPGFSLQVRLLRLQILQVSLKVMHDHARISFAPDQKTQFHAWSKRLAEGWAQHTGAAMVGPEGSTPALKTFARDVEAQARKLRFFPVEIFPMDRARIIKEAQTRKGLCRRIDKLLGESKDVGESWAYTFSPSDLGKLLGLFHSLEGTWPESQRVAAAWSRLTPDQQFERRAERLWLSRASNSCEIGHTKLYGSLARRWDEFDPKLRGAAIDELKHFGQALSGPQGEGRVSTLALMTLRYTLLELEKHGRIKFDSDVRQIFVRWHTELKTSTSDFEKAARPDEEIGLEDTPANRRRWASFRQEVLATLAFAKDIPTILKFRVN